jgi:hypothetical protein
LSGREKIEKDYRKSEKRIEKEVEEEMAQIKSKANEVKVDAEKIGEALEISINQNEERRNKKKS